MTPYLQRKLHRHKANQIEQIEEDGDLEHDVHALPHHQPVHQVHQVQVGQLPVQAQHLVVDGGIVGIFVAVVVTMEAATTLMLMWVGNSVESSRFTAAWRRGLREGTLLHIT